MPSDSSRGQVPEVDARLLLVLPTYNEALNLPLLVPRLLAASPVVDILVVDDGSPDGTARVVRGLAAQESRISLLERARKSGRGNAVLAGFAHGVGVPHYAHFAEMDADISHQPEEIGTLLDAAHLGADLVIASRYVPGAPPIEGWSGRRRVWSRTSNGLIKHVLRLPVTDITNGYRLYSRRAVEYLVAQELRESGFISLSEWAFLLHRAGMKIAEVPSRFVNRRLGKSNMSAAEALGAARALVRLRRCYASGHDT